MLIIIIKQLLFPSTLRLHGQKFSLKVSKVVANKQKVTGSEIMQVSAQRCEAEPGVPRSIYGQYHTLPGPTLVLILE